MQELQRGLDEESRLRSWLPVVLQAVLFGLLHYRGVPSGPVGVVMAGGWGFLLGWLRRHTGGLVTPLAAHVAADVVIFGILLASR